ELDQSLECDALIARYLAYMYVRDDLYQEAIKYYEIAQKPKKPLPDYREMLLELSTCYFKIKDYEKNHAILNDLVENYPIDIQTLSGYALSNQYHLMER